MKKILAFLFSFVAVGMVIYLFYLQIVAPFAYPGKQPDDTIPPTETPIPEARARFLIFTNRTKRLFTESKYHNRSGAAYIHPSNPSQVIVKVPGTTWGEFFTTLPAPMKISPSCLMTGTGQRFCTGEAASLSFYLNGEKVPDALHKVINDGDTLLVTFGTEEDALDQLQNF